MAIEAERWSYIIGVAIVAAGGTPPPDADTAASAFEGRTANGLREAAHVLSLVQSGVIGTVYIEVAHLGVIAGLQVIEPSASVARVNTPSGKVKPHQPRLNGSSRRM